MLYGPNTGVIHNSIILMIEAQSRYINILIGAVLQARASGKSLRMVPTPTGVEDFNKKLQIRLNASSLAHPSCTSWFKNEEGTITNTWSGTVVDYQSMMARISWDDYSFSGEGNRYGEEHTISGEWLRNQTSVTEPWV